MIGSFPWSSRWQHVDEVLSPMASARVMLASCWLHAGYHVYAGLRSSSKDPLGPITGGQLTIVRLLTTLEYMVACAFHLAAEKGTLCSP